MRREVAGCGFVGCWIVGLEVLVWLLCYPLLRVLLTSNIERRDTSLLIRLLFLLLLLAHLKLCPTTCCTYLSISSSPIVWLPCDLYTAAAPQTSDLALRAPGLPDSPRLQNPILVPTFLQHSPCRGHLQHCKQTKVPVQVPGT